MTMGKEESVSRLREVCEQCQVNVFGPAFLSFLMDKDSTRMLGSGGYGSCQLVSVSSSLWVAKTCGTSRCGPQTLIQEIKALSALHGVAGVQKLVGVCPEALTLVTEYSGETWSDVLERRQASVQVCLEVTSQVCRIMSTIHARGWTHMDIKANNVCV
ncbi:proto-oncogene tyrosine-protein kinase Src-like [Procambarus clarkii]|uniref:proto-oncogene tyrosine-protein kinase Src-like n=1 Tax=Procambarus clarkii TaxID=6728 RepID=UPI003743F9BA